MKKGSRPYTAIDQSTKTSEGGTIKSRREPVGLISCLEQAFGADRLPLVMFAGPRDREGE